MKKFPLLRGDTNADYGFFLVVFLHVIDLCKGVIVVSIGKDNTFKALTDERSSRLQGLSFAIFGYGLAAIRGAFILNGAAAIAVLTRQEPITQEGNITILFCAIGASLAVLCAGASFVTQWF